MIINKIQRLPEAPLRPEARGICHICHMVNPALSAIIHIQVFLTTSHIQFTAKYRILVIHIGTRLRVAFAAVHFVVQFGFS